MKVSIFGMLVMVAAATFVLGWLVVIVDAISGCRLIDKLPTRLIDIFEAIHKTAWISIGMMLLALAIVEVSGVSL